MIGTGWFLKNPNIAGYRVDITEPEMSQKYAEYKKANGLAYGEPMSNAQRLAFEAEIFALYFRLNSGEIQKKMGGMQKR